MSKSIVAFPYTYDNGVLKVVLVTTKRGRHWILPKGHPEKKFSRSAVALIEAYEEAGVLGYPEPKGLKKSFKRDDDLYDEKLIAYPILIGKLLDEWEENDYRQRKIVTITEALELVSQPLYRDIIFHFAQLLTSKDVDLPLQVQ